MRMDPLSLWEAMTPLGQAVVVALLLLSIRSLYVSIERTLVFRRARRQSRAFARLASRSLDAQRLREVADGARRFPESHLARVTRAGLEPLLDERRGRLPAHDRAVAAHRAMERETQRVQAALESGIPGLATIATTAPFVGLLGTVIGIIEAFRAIAVEQAGGMGVVSASISEALVATALGLFVAIPAAWMFNHFAGKLKLFQVEMANASSELLDYLGAGSAASDPAAA